MHNCLITKLKSSITEGNLPKLGELILTVKPYDKNDHVAYSRVVMGSEDNCITILKGGYFCKTLKDTTPINGTIEESLIKTTSGRFVLYFTEDEIQLKIKNKYTFKGIGYNYSDYAAADGNSLLLNNIIYNVNEIEYCPNWVLFSRVAKPIELKNKIVNAITSSININLDGALLQGDNVVPGGVVYLTNATGNIKKISRVAVEIRGDFSVDITNCVFDGSCIMLSPNIYGDIKNPQTRWFANYVVFGNDNNYTRLTCSEPITKQLTQPNKDLTIYSSEFTLNHIKNLINFPHVSNVIIYTPLVTIEEVNADSDVMTKIANLKSAGGRISINGTRM